MPNNVTNPLVDEIKTILDIARSNVAKAVNSELIASYWKIGEIIVRYEQNDSIRAEYGEQTLKQSLTGKCHSLNKTPSHFGGLIWKILFQAL